MVESGIKHHNPNPCKMSCRSIKSLYSCDKKGGLQNYTYSFNN